MLNAVAKAGIGWLARTPPFRSRTERRLREGLNVVYSHHVGQAVPYYADWYNGSTIERLDRDVTALKTYFEFVPLADLIRGRARSEPHPLMALTFDDGFDMLRNGVMELLDHHGIRVTSFILTGMVGNVNLMWRNKLAAIRALRQESLYVGRYNDLMAKAGLPQIAGGDELLRASARWPMARKEELVDALWKACDMPELDEFLEQYRPYFTWDGLRRWLAAGHDVGLHTATHPFCSGLASAGIRAEIEEPAALLRTKLDVRFLPFSYPFGIRLPAPVERQLYEAGVFDCAFGIEGFVPHGTPHYRLERASIEGNELTFSVFGRALLGRTRRFSRNRAVAA